MGLVTLDYTNKIMRIKCVNADIGYRVSCFPNQPNGYIVHIGAGGPCFDQPTHRFQGVVSIEIGRASCRERV